MNQKTAKRLRRIDSVHLAGFSKSRFRILKRDWNRTPHNKRRRLLEGLARGAQVEIRTKKKIEQEEKRVLSKAALERFSS